MSTIYGTAFNDVITETFNNDSIFSFNGNDYIYGGYGFDFIDGGGGYDTVDYSYLGQAITLEATGLVQKGNAGADQLFLVENIIAPGNQFNVINAAAGSNSPIAIAVDLSLSSLSVYNIPQVGTLNLTVQNFSGVVGTAQADYIAGNSQDNFLDGGAGNDYLYGGAGNDLIYGFSGDDVIDSGSGDDSLFGESGNDYFYGNYGFDSVNGGVGFDTIDYSYLGQQITLEATGAVKKGNAGADQLFLVENIIAPSDQFNIIDASSGGNSQVSINVDLSSNSLTVNNIPQVGTLNLTVQNFLGVVGTAQADSIAGNSQDNFLDGGAGNDYLFGGKGSDLIYGGSGNDTLDGWEGNDTLYGESGDDMLMGYSGNDVLFGGSGSDILEGESGNDVLNGYGFTAGEFDLLIGGGGADLFVLGDAGGSYYLGNGYATIADFSASQQDAIQVFGSLSNYSLSFQNSIGGSLLDTLIYKGNDLIGVVQDTTNVNLVSA